MELAGLLASKSAFENAFSSDMPLGTSEDRQLRSIASRKSTVL